MSEKVRAGEQEILKVKGDNESMKNELNSEIADLQNKKNMAQGELLGLEQRIVVKDEEIEKLLALQTTSVSDFESRTDQFRQTLAKAQLEIQRKDNEIKDLVTNNSQGSSQLKKDNALLEQRIELN